MSIRTKLLAWRNINTDSDFSKYIETVSNPWVIEWLEVVSWKVKVWKAWVLAERTNWETIQVLVENINEVSIDTSWTWCVIISIPQNMIDDWSLINEDWTNVATIEVVENLPTKNYLELAQLDSWVITDKRNILKKVWELLELIESDEDDIEDLDERVEALEKAGAIDHLEEQAVVWENYALTDNLFKQITPLLSVSTNDTCHIWDVAWNTEIHIQRIANGLESNKLKLYLKKEWSPTTNLKIEVRKWIKVDVSTSEAYWYWDEENILATWNLSYTDFTTDFAEKEITLDNAIIQEEWTLLDIVLYQETWWSKIVNSDNYYILWSDTTQWSEAFSFVAVNWETRSRNKLMPYCVSWAFADILLVKQKTTAYSDISISPSTNIWSKWTPKWLYAIWEIWYIITFWNLNDDYYLENLDFPTWKNEITSASWSRTWWDWSNEEKSFTLEKSWFYIVRASWNAMATSVRLAFPNWFEYYLWQWVWSPGYSSNCYHSSMVYLYAWTYKWKFYSWRYQSTYGTVTCKLFK